MSYIRLALLLFLIAARGAEDLPTSTDAPPVNGYSAAALFNQGNASARAGRPGWAILSYERAQLLTPNNDDLTANLHLIRQKQGIPDPSSNWWSLEQSLATSNTLAWLGCLGIVLIGISLLLLRYLPQRRETLFSLLGVGSLLVVLAVGSACSTWGALQMAVIVSHDSTAARISPSKFAETSFALKEGETVTVDSEHGDFALVLNREGRMGWVQRQDLIRVVPAGSSSSHPEGKS